MKEVLKMNKYNVGDVVVIKENPSKTHTITEVREITYSDSGWGYIIDPIDTTWYPFKEESIELYKTSAKS